MSNVTPEQARHTYFAMLPIHGLIYFVPEGPERYAPLGLETNRQQYFGPRGAAMGDVPPELIAAAFYTYDPGLVGQSMSDVWRRIRPADVVAARLSAADAALRRILGRDVAGPEVAEAADLARHAALAAGEYLHGRALFAGHASLDWPDTPHLVLWHAHTLLREYRGDGHHVALQAHGVSGIEAARLHHASGAPRTENLQASKGWDDEAWRACTIALRERGALGSDGSLTQDGIELRARVEKLTDELATPAMAVLGAERCARLAEVAEALGSTILASLNTR